MKVYAVTRTELQQAIREIENKAHEAREESK